MANCRSAADPYGYYAQYAQQTQAYYANNPYAAFAYMQPNMAPAAAAAGASGGNRAAQVYTIPNVRVQSSQTGPGQLLLWLWLLWLSLSLVVVGHEPCGGSVCTHHCDTTGGLRQDVVGRIIGKGGTSIRQIQDQSGAHVDVPRDVGQPTRSLSITGDAAQIQACIALINQKIQSRV
jgi:hypothetical protein